MNGCYLFSLKLKAPTRSTTIIFHVFNFPISATTNRRVGDCWLNSFIKRKLIMDKTLLEVVVERVGLSSWAGQSLGQGRIISGRNEQLPFLPYLEWIPLYSGIKSVMFFKDFFLVNQEKKNFHLLEKVFLYMVHYLHVSIQFISFKTNQSKTACVYGVKGNISRHIAKATIKCSPTVGGQFAIPQHQDDKEAMGERTKVY